MTSSLYRFICANPASFRCGANNGIQSINSSYYHASINVTVPTWQQSTVWGANGVLARFDNVLMSLWVLFQIATLENWNNIMYFAMWTNGVDEQPVSEEEARGEHMS
jgi:hypothetical protein